MRMETSYGAKHSKIDPWARVGKSDAYTDDTDGIKGVWFRLSIGYGSDPQEDQKNITKMLEYMK